MDDGIYFFALLLFGALTGALLALCIALAPRAGQPGSHDGASPQARDKNSARDRGLS